MKDKTPLAPRPKTKLMGCGHRIKIEELKETYCLTDREVVKWLADNTHCIDCQYTEAVIKEKRRGYKPLSVAESHYYLLLASAERYKRIPKLQKELKKLKEEAAFAPSATTVDKAKALEFVIGYTNAFFWIESVGMNNEMILARGLELLKEQRELNRRTRN